MEWFSENGRHLPWRGKAVKSWVLLVTEMLLQQTQAERVADFFHEFFEEFPSPSSVLAVDEEVLCERLAPLGLQRKRSQRIREHAHAIQQMGSGLPSTMSELQDLPGVGPYIAAAYLSVILGQPEPTVDVNMARLLERVYGPRRLVDIRYDPHVNGTARRLIQLVVPPKRFNWAVLDLAAANCKARRPVCDNCPLLLRCSYGKRNAIARNGRRN